MTYLAKKALLLPKVAFVGQTVQRYWFRDLLKHAIQKSTLKWLDLDLLRPLAPHPAWACCKSRPYTTQLALSRVKLLTDTMPLYKWKVKTNKASPNTTCPICRCEEEDAQHLLMRCKHPDMAEKREEYQKRICDVMGLDSVDELGEHEWVMLILNG